MYYVFLDVDGVLNSLHSKGFQKGFTCLDDYNIQVLKYFLTECYTRYGKDNVSLVLSSSWRKGKSQRNGFREILDEYLAKSDIHVDGETPECSDTTKGIEIITYLSRQMDVINGYLVLDDKCFPDFKPLYITKHFLQTSDNNQSGVGGLRKHYITKMCQILSKPLQSKEIQKIRAINF